MEKGIDKNIVLPDVDIGKCDCTKGELDATEYNFGIVVSRFNGELTGQLLKSALDCLEKHGATPESIEIVWVPGAYEIPLAVDQLASFGNHNAVIALGCVIQGETPHADLINRSVAHALMEIGRNSVTPVINEVVGTYNVEQAEARCKYGEDSRGWYAAAAAIEMASVMKKMDADFVSKEEIF